jgi:ABC-type lipoprotein export system ATPase subunit
MEEAVIVETRKLTKIYGGSTESICALDEVDLQVRSGEFTAIIGPSGSGKSTLLNMIGALDRPTRGEVLVNGESLSKIRDLDHFRSLTVGFVFQTHNLIPTLSARENVEVPMYSVRQSASQKHKRADELLENVGLGPRSKHLPNMLSGGERQRVAIARSLANNPAIVLADEPTGNLDSQNTNDILKLLEELNRQRGVTILVVTHNHEVARMTQRVITMRDGKIHEDVLLKNAYDRDLLDFKYSSLGQAILHNMNLREDLMEIAPRLREIFRHI